jgi:hypothetical protein
MHTIHGYKIKLTATMIILLILTAILFLSSCSAYKGYAVILWAEDTWPYENGDIANISRVYDTDRKYIAIYEKDIVELAMWRVLYFESYDEAKTFAESYQPFINTYALCRRNDLPVRSEADTGTERVTKLKSGEVVKVIEKGRQEKIGNMDDSWYLILTIRGYLGYTYGYYLDISDDPTNFEKKSPTLLDPESLIEALLDNTWVPEIIEEMVKSGIYDLNVLKKYYGLTLDQEEKKVILNLPGFNKVYQYTSIAKTASGKLTFAGTDLTVEISPSSNKILVHYVKNEKSVKSELIMLDKDLNQIIREEQQRRNDLFSSIMSNGNVLRSQTGGTIRLASNWSFTWEDWASLSPHIIPENSSGQGNVDFKYFLSFGLRSRYDGAITFYFKGNPGFERTFAFTLAGNSIKMIYVPGQDIENLMIMRASSSSNAFDFNFYSE